MATITEDYCSKEIYRLLIEKGFGGEVHTTFDKEGYTQPSITPQMAMKWLREVHNWNIVIRKSHTIYGYDIYIESLVASNIIEGAFEKTYEQAVEAAIKHCLENLI